MFGHQDNPSPPGDEQETERPQFRMPTLSTWEIWYVGLSSSGKPVKETVSGHGMTLGPTGSMTIQTFYLDPVLGPTPRPVWGRSSYVSFRDVTPPVPAVEAEESRLVSLH